MSSRPGIIIVTSRPTTADFTADDLSKWYTEKHIPDVLATGGVQGALWCQLAASAGQVNGQAPPVPYLAMYYLPDLNWLHEESCQFWKLSMELDPKDMETAQRRNVFHVAEFSTASWELDEGLQITGLMPTSAVTHGGNEEEATNQLILAYVDTTEPGVSVVPVPIQSGSRVRSLRCKPNSTCPFPPAGVGKNAGEDPPKRWLFCHELFGAPAITNWVTGAEILKYTILGEFGDTQLEGLREYERDSIQGRTLFLGS